MRRHFVFCVVALNWSWVSSFTEAEVDDDGALAALEGSGRQFGRQFGPFEYIHPRLDAQLVSPLTTIAVRQGSLIKAESIQGKIKVHGSKSGNVQGEIVLAADGQTVIFRGNKPFKLGESVQVSVLGGLKTAAGFAGGLQWRFTVRESLPFSTDPLSKREKLQEQRRKIRPVGKSYVLDPPSVPDDAKSGMMDDYFIPRGVREGSNHTMMRGTFGFKNGFELMNTFPVAKYLQRNYKTIPPYFPRIRMSVPAKEGVQEGYVFFTNRRGPTNQREFEREHPWLMMLDNEGDIVFFTEVPGMYDSRGNLIVTDAKMLSFDAALFDHRFKKVKTFTEPHGYKKDGHDFKIDKDGGAIMMHEDTQYMRHKGRTVRINAAVFTEQDKYGNPVFEWRMWDYMTVDEMLQFGMLNDQGDVAHPNGISRSPDGNHVYSLRHMGVMKVNRRTGDVMWRLGGHHGFSDFKFVNEPRPFAFQHFAHEIKNGNILMFDNHVNHDGEVARAVEYQLDHKAKTATKVWEYTHGNQIYSLANGSVQRLSNGNTAICWGGMGVGPDMQGDWSAPFYTEVKPNGEVVMEMYFEDGQNSHSAHKYTRDQWWAEPHWPPALVLDSSNKDKIPRIHFSWNGATNVAKWLVYQGENGPPKRLTKTIDRKQFEHFVKVERARQVCEHYQVVAVDSNGKRLKASAVVKSYACKKNQ
ncbi:unnamed protein product [Vitrella brassicaformis CCMP3155]|uniref:Uncharacterized protein n=1 Tax=Vitrella brassicaformis (strain CCMP3155) TaxID=1169540 RepID=A0A0G4GJ86_VITBC|nr:unnamed protein product [Vitrella brassicaformis CCMP3155]|eukprot:CEM29881.1 unnamed protein product [Vitrella brassicaformis CCMP3155]